MNKIILALSITTLTAGAAFAQASFESVDADANGIVTFTEASDAGLPWTEDQFKLADTNGDGGLDQDEFTAAAQ